MNRTARAAGCSHSITSRINHVKYKQTTRWDQNCRPPVPYLQRNVQNCNYQHWCETCDKGFTTARFLENHKLQHQKCNIDGCQFVAHPKIITKHIQMQHSTGLFKRIAKLNNPEDVKKWREERKKKYPTIENIKRKEAEIKEKIKRGEKMGIKYERNKRNDKWQETQINNRLSQTRRIKHPQGKYNANISNGRKRVATNSPKKSEIPKKICKVVPPIEETRKLKPFAGIQSLTFDDAEVVEEILETQSNNLIEDDSDEDTHVPSDTILNESTTSEPKVCSALTSLICCYGSSDEDDNEINILCKETIKAGCPKKVPKAESFKNDTKLSNNDNHLQNNDKINDLKTVSTEKISHDTNIVLQQCKSIVSNCQSFSDEESGPEEIKIIKEETTPLVDNTKVSSTKPKKELSFKQITKASNKKYEFKKRNKLPSTLLQKLLHREIQHERNVILQCVRYVVKNKYFENH